jgi:hypothetical protein
MGWKVNGGVGGKQMGWKVNRWVGGVVEMIAR